MVTSNKPSYQRGARDANGQTDKDRFFERWLESAKQGKKLDLDSAQKLFPNRAISTLRNWLSWFNKGGRNYRDRGFPRAAFGRHEEIIQALRKLYGNQSLTSKDVQQIISATTPIRSGGNNHANLPLKKSAPPPTPKAVDLEPPQPERISTTVNRIVRDTELARRIKLLHAYKCQICGHTIKLADGLLYAEAHHIQPLGKDHNGHDVKGNILCVCPNHHAELDLGARRIKVSELTTAAGHTISQQYVDYHNKKIYRPS